MDAQDATLEGALARTEDDIDAALKTAADMTSKLKQAKKAAAFGVLRDLEKHLEISEQLAGALRDKVRNTRGGWAFDDRAYLGSGAFANELLQLGNSRGLVLREQDDQLVGYPSVVRVLPDRAAIQIGTKKQQGIRPSVVVEKLRLASARAPRFRPATFVEALARAYEFIRASQGKEPGATVKLEDVYRLLTVLPGQSKDYSQQEFARDIYLLDESGVDRTKNDSRMSLPASSGARTSSKLTTVTREGGIKIYYGIEFR